MRFVLSVLLLVLFGSITLADIPTEDGFSFQAGYWWRSGVPYNRTKITGGYWRNISNGCGGYYSSYQPTYYYDYTKVVQDVSAVSSTDPDYRSKLLAIAKARDEVTGAIRKATAQSNDFQAEVKALGLDGNFRWDNYGLSPVPPLPNGLAAYSAVGNYGASGTTVYGYNVVADGYGQLDLNTLMQQWAASVRDAQTAAGQAHIDFADIVKLANQGAASVAEIKAKGQAAVELAKQIKAEPRVKLEGRVFSYKVDPQGNLVSIPPVVMIDPKQPTANAFVSCISCHSGAEAKGKYDITKFDSMTPDQQWSAVMRVTTDDLTKRMPRKADGSVGDRLSPQEVMGVVAKVKK